MHPSTRYSNRSLNTIKHQDKILSTGPNPMVYSLIPITSTRQGLNRVKNHKKLWAQKNKPNPQTVTPNGLKDIYLKL